MASAVWGMAPDWFPSESLNLSEEQRARRFHLVTACEVSHVEALMPQGQAMRPCDLCDYWLRREIEGPGNSRA